MDVVKITPRGYCYGVVDALELVRKVARDPSTPRPIHVLGLIVHNHHLVEEMDRLGVITLDGPDRLSMLESVQAGTVVFTAHGVSPQVRRRAQEKGLRVMDATCPDVTRTHDLVRELAGRGYEIIYIGRRGHPEPEGAVGVAPDRVHLVQNEADVDALSISGDRIAVTNQTTLSLWDTAAIVQRIRQRYPAAEVFNEICLATQQRQEAVAAQAPGCDMVLVVGDVRSNNSNRLVQVAREVAGVEAHLVDSVADIRPEWLVGKQRVAVTSGASTPSPVTREVIRFLAARAVPVTVDPDLREPETG